MSESPFRLPPGPARRKAMREHPGQPNISPLDFTDDENELIDEWAAQAEAALDADDLSAVPAFPVMR